MAELFNADKSIYAQVQQLVAHYHPHLAPVVDQIGIVFKEKASRSGDYAHVAKIKKAPNSLINALTGQEYQFIIEIGNDEWAGMNDAQRVALLDHCLCGANAEEVDGGGYKFTLRAPPIQFYPEEVERHGYWRHQNPISAVIPLDKLQELFGE